MDKTLKEALKKYQENLSKYFASHINGLEQALSSYEKDKKEAEEKINPVVAEKISDIRKGLARFSEMNTHVQRLRDRL